MSLRPARWLGFFILGLVYFLFTSDAWAAFSFSIDKVDPLSVNAKDQDVKVTLSIKGLPSESYFRVGWKKGNSYFGYIKNNEGNWVKIEALSSDCSHYYHVPQTGNSQLTLVTKIGEETNIESGSYVIKAHRFTATGNCSYTASVNTETIEVNLAEASLPSPSPSPSPSSPPSSSSASYKINSVKDEDGNTLSSVKVYLDGVYLKHYAPETLTFCDGCSCDSLTSCDFGGHTIKLEKSGYQDWEETRNITSGGSYEVNPVMSATSSESTSSSEDTASPSPQVLGTTAKTKTSKKTVFGQSIDSESMLGEFASFSGEVLGATEGGEKEAEEEVEEGQNYNWLVPLGLSGSGLVLLGAASFPFVKPRVVSFLKKPKP